MNEEILLRLASEKDFPDIEQAAREIWTEHYTKIISPEQVKYMLDIMYSQSSLAQQHSEGHLFALTCISEQIRGFGSISKNADGFFVHKLYLYKNQRGMGTGKKLMNFMCETAGVQPGDTLRLAVNRRNTGAINFYFRNGFIIESTQDKDIGCGFFMNDFIMAKRF